MDGMRRDKTQAKAGLALGWSRTGTERHIRLALKQKRARPENAPEKTGTGGTK